MSEIDPLAIVRELGVGGSHSASVLAENRGKGVWRIQGDAGAFALRVLRPDEHETALSEQRAMDAARAAGAPAPEVVAAGDWRRRPVMLLSWCEGETLRDAIRKRPGTAFRLGLACGREQARLHELVAPPSLAADRWQTRFGPIDPELDQRLESIERSRSSLLHLDFHMDNVLMSGGQVSGLVDWTNACAGDPRADVARTWSLLTRRTGAGVRARATASLWRLVGAGWQRGYEQAAGRQHDMLLFRIWALTGLLNTSPRVEAERAGRRHELTLLQTRLAQMRNRAGLSPTG